MKITRRHFLLGSSAGLLVAGASSLLRLFPRPRLIPGKILGASSSLGHKLRTGGFPPPSQTIRKDVVIVGGGIAGLAAGYSLAKAGFRDFIVLDLENQAGGNSQSGRNAVSAYPWGAHYVPLLTEEATAVKSLFEELGIITGYNAEGIPTYNEFYICADPHERLYIYGRWQEGLIPVIGTTPQEEEQYKRFFALMDGYKKRKGRDGKRAFSIPVDKSSQDGEFLALDEMTMEEWMNGQGFTSPDLLWYIDYCCRDDYGTTFRETSAWAGVHYFAARNGRAANTAPQNVITWPDGNGWLVNRLTDIIGDSIETQALAYRITDGGDSVTIDYWDNRKEISTRIEAKAAIICTPRFVAARILDSKKSFPSADEFSYAPWAVANITLSKMPAGQGAPLSWDNVIYKSRMLGYVVATHQIPQMKPVQTVLTYYWPLSHASPAEARQEALGRSHQEWQEIILKELLSVHPELNGHIEQMDVWVWGHAMIRPTKGFIWGKARKAALKQHPPLFTAHSDMSGISIFEEAWTRGVASAEQAMDYLNVPYRSML